MTKYKSLITQNHVNGKLVNMNKIINADCIKAMKKLKDNSVDAIVTDPPYGIGFMDKGWDTFSPEYIKKGVKKNIGSGDKSARGRNDTSPAWVSARYDRSLNGLIGFQKWMQKVSKECLRILKPGGYMLVFGGTRTYHRLVCGIEDAGFEIRDTILWLYGSGFPKSLNIGKQIDKMAEKDLEVIKAKEELGKWLKQQRGNKPQKEISKHFLSKTGRLTGCVANWELGLNLPTWSIWIKLKEILSLDDRFDYLIEGRPKNYIPAEREIVGLNPSARPNFRNHNVNTYPLHSDNEKYITSPTTPEAKEWEGWGTALKPACEPIVVARKPLSEKNVALNVLKWGTGGINIDDCRIGTHKYTQEEWSKKGLARISGNAYGEHKPSDTELPQGRFPANIILDEMSAKMLDLQSGEIPMSARPNVKGKEYDSILNANVYGKYNPTPIDLKYTDKGGASRFFQIINNNICSLCDMPIAETFKKDKNNNILCKKLFVNNVKMNLKTTQAIKGSSVQKDVMGIPKEKLDQIVRCVGNLCQECEISIVQDIVRIKNLDSKKEELQVMQDFTVNYKKCILIQNLVNYVEIMDNIDTTPTTQNLLKLFGSVNLVITNYIQETERFVQKDFYTKPKRQRVKEMLVVKN